MSLSEKADGILETHVTWDDVEKHLQKNLDTKATFGDKKSAINISDMKGFMSRIALVEPDWQGVEEGKELPQKFIVKISSLLALYNLKKVMIFGDEKEFDEKIKKFGWISRDVHNREVEVYKLLQRFNHPDIPYTQVYALKSFDGEDDLKAYIVAAYVPNVHSVGVHESIPADDLVSLSRGIGTFAGLGETLTEEEKKFAGGEEYLEMMFKEIFDDKSMENMFDNLRKAMGEEQKEDVEKLIEIYWHYFKLVPKYTNISKTLGMKTVLNHGDLWQTNMLHSLDKDGKRVLEAMIDWQACSRVLPGMDNSRLLMGCLSTEDRRSRGKELLKVYHEAFTTACGQEMFTFDELCDSYSLYMPTMAMVIQPGMMSFMDASDIPEEDKNAIRSKVLEKMIGIMEDVFEVHDYNLKNFPDFMKL